MNKVDRDQLRKVLAFHPGEIVPLPGTNTIIELLDQIDELEQEQAEIRLSMFLDKLDKALDVMDILIKAP